MKPKHYAWWLLAVTFLYFEAGRLGLSQAMLHANVSPVWPPTGLAIAALWWLGERISPAVFLGAFLLNLATGVSVTTAAGIALGNTLEAFSAFFLMRRFLGNRNPFHRAGDTVRFVLITGLVSTTISATVGNISLCLGGAASWNNFGPLWLTWWLGDEVGALVVAPLLMTWIDSARNRWTLRQVGEALLFLVSLLIGADIVFGGLFLPKLGSYHLEHLMMPFLLWAAFKFGPSGAASTIFVMSTIATWGTRRGFGPFAEHNPNESLLLLQVFVGGAAITTLVLAAIVNERKRGEEALRSKETQLQLITDITPVMLTQCNRELQFRFSNPAYANIFGATPEQIAGRPIVDVIGQEAFETVRPYIERVLEGQRIEYETEIPYKGVGRRYMRIAYMPDRDERGKVVGWIASLDDITDRKRTEEQIQKLNAELQRRIDEFQALIETAPVGIAIAMDAECSYIWGNREFIHMLGADPQQNISKSGPEAEALAFKILRNGREVPAKDLPIQVACREGREVLDEEVEIIRSDGRTVHELCRATPLRDEHGRVRGCIGVFLNITERKQADKEREELLAREQEARAEVEAASRVKDEFLAVISHELRTPLNSILGWAQLVRTGRLDPTTAARGMETIERNAKAQAQLVDDLLDVSSVISGKLRLDLKPMKLTTVVNAVIDSLRHLLETKGIHLNVAMDPAAASVQGDPTRLQQVIWNLLSNSTKFTAKGGRIDVRLEREGSFAKLSVADTGEGIRPEFLPYVFDRFRQEDSSRTRKHGGLGLGLAIVHHLIEMHGGVVEAYSEGENQGTTLIVKLPLLEPVDEADRTLRPTRPAQTPTTLAGIRTLVVEDNPDSLEMLRMVIELHGAEVRTATTASEALRIYQSWAPDVLVSDLGLPDEDGYTLLKRLMAIEKRGIQAIALTGYVGEKEGKRALASGFQMYLTKPVEPRNLVKAISDLIAQARAR